MRAFGLSGELLARWLAIALAALFLSAFPPFHAFAAPTKVKQAQGKTRHVAQHSRHAVKKAKPGAAKKSAIKKKAKKARIAAKPPRQKKHGTPHAKRPVQKAPSRIPHPASEPGIKPAMAPIAAPNAALTASPPVQEVRMACSLNGKIYLMRDCGDATPHIADTAAR